MSTYRKKLIEVALPLEALNAASYREGFIYKGNPSAIHKWWAQRPLATARAVLFAQLVDDPSSWPDLFHTAASQNEERQRLFRLIESLVEWENSGKEEVIRAARLEIARSHARSGRSARGVSILSGSAPSAVVDEYLASELPAVQDPFSGGGTIPLEAQRLGLRTVASDLNPVAVLITKILVEFVPRFAGTPPVSGSDRDLWQGCTGLAEDLRFYGNWVLGEAKRQLAHLYPTLRVTPALAATHAALRGLEGRELPILAWLWARTVASPDPATGGAHVPLATSFWLSKKPAHAAWVEPIVGVDKRTYRFDVRTGQPANAAAIDKGTRAGKAQSFKCVLSGNPIARDYIRDEGKGGRLGQRLMAVAVSTPSGRRYVGGDTELERSALVAETDPRVTEARGSFLAGSTPTRAMITGGVCSAYGLSTWGHLYTGRQLIALLTLSDLIIEARSRVLSDARRSGSTEGKAVKPLDADTYADAVTTLLAFALDKTVEYSNTLVPWYAKEDRPKGVFARQALPMVWDFAEVNVLGEMGGTFWKSVQLVADAVPSLPLPGPIASVGQADAAALDYPDEVIISTDPPYYDNIGYADLSDFFYPWLRRVLRERYPSIFATVLVPKADELVATPFRHGSPAAAETFFLAGMTRALRRMAGATGAGAVQTIYYAFRQSEHDEGGVSSTGWETFLEAVLSAGFALVGTWPMRTERGSRAVGLEANALASSVVLVCRERPQDAVTTTRGEFRRVLRKELPEALAKLQQGNIAPVDVAQASIGPGMAIFSRHRGVVEADGSAMTVRGALELINEVLDEYLASGEGDFDSDTRFAITWYEQHGWEAGAYGDAENIANARNISVKGVVEAGVARSGAGKVSLLRRDELPREYDPAADARPTVWEFTQHMIRYLEEQGEEAAARHLKRLGARADATRELAYRLYNTCERKKWAEDARSYNGLILAWPELEKLAARMTDEAPSAALSKPSRPGKRKPTKGQQPLFDGDKK